MSRPFPSSPRSLPERWRIFPLSNFIVIVTPRYDLWRVPFDLTYEIRCPNEAWITFHYVLLGSRRWNNLFGKIRTTSLDANDNRPIHRWRILVSPLLFSPYQFLLFFALHRFFRKSHGRHGRDGASVARSKTRRRKTEERTRRAQLRAQQRIVFPWGSGKKERERSEIFCGARDRFSP